MRSKILLFSTLTTLFLTSSALSQDGFADVEISSQPVSGSVHMLQGMGGNIGVSAGATSG